MYLGELLENCYDLEVSNIKKIQKIEIIIVYFYREIIYYFYDYMMMLVFQVFCFFFYINDVNVFILQWW